ncbi:MAG: cytochrome C [Opitutae bacterium]|nr:cytochrome C [Opitutae bacterium]
MLALRRSSVAAGFFGAVLAAGATAFAGVTGSIHDFSARGWTGGESCKVCHVPHHAEQTLADAPLWNHTTTVAAFTLYRSSTLHKTVGEPGTRSKACLSCHDGTVALNSFGGAVGGEFAAGRALVGPDLSDDHPVGIAFYHAPGLVCSNCHGGRPMRLVSTLPFFDGKVECASCHDVHNQRVGGARLVRTTLAGSALCLHCHPK